MSCLPAPQNGWTGIVELCIPSLKNLLDALLQYYFLFREKKLLVGSDDYGRDLTGVQNLKKKHKRLEAELASHEPAIQAVQSAGERLKDVSNLGVPEIETRLRALNDAWTDLKTLAAMRGHKLDDSLTYQQFLAKVEEEEAWIRCDISSHYYL